jgi:hypothetical protein
MYSYIVALTTTIIINVRIMTKSQTTTEYRTHNLGCVVIESYVNKGNLLIEVLFVFKRCVNA